MNPEKLSNFDQYLKRPNRVNCIKGLFSQYNKNSAFGILDAPFNSANLQIKTRFIRYVLTPSIKTFSDNMYCYFPIHCANGGPQVKGIDFDQYSSPVLAAPTLWLIIAISTTYDLIIGITDVTNAFQNSLTDSSDQ